MATIYRYTEEDIPRLRRTCDALVEKLKDQIPIAWGSFIDRGRDGFVTPDTLASFLFPHTLPKPHELYVAHVLLSTSTTYFRKEEKYAYSCRSAKEVDERKKRVEIERKEANRAQDFMKRMRRIISGGMGKEGIKWSPQDQKYLAILKSYAATHPSDSLDKWTADTLLRPLGLGVRRKDAFQLLRSLDLLSRYENLAIYRYPRPLSWNKEEEERWEKLTLAISRGEKWEEMPSPPGYDLDEKIRVDLTSSSYPSFAIDDPSPADDDVEIDDAIGLRPDGWIAIHIADPSRLVSPRSALDRAAEERGESIFLPETTHYMFPPSLSRHQFSLRQQKANFALSFLVRLDKEGKVEEYKIVPSKVDNISRLRYYEADRMLERGEGESEALSELERVSMLRKKWRENVGGGVVADIPRCDVRVGGKGEGRIRVNLVRDSTSRSRAIISEFMILAGEVAADFAKKNNIPIPFRTQERRYTSYTKEPQDEMGWISKLTRQMDLVSAFAPARTEVAPRPHASLGLSQYCKVSSPIRRYSDLIVHQQIKAKLRGEKLPYNEDEIKGKIEEMDRASACASKLISESVRYWVLRYLERERKMGHVYSALVMSVGEEEETGACKARVLLLELGFRTEVTLERRGMRGEIVHLVVSKCDPLADVLEMTTTNQTSPHRTS